MANIKLNKKTFEKEIGKITEDMQNKIAMMGCTVESVTNEEIELEIFPNRPDLLSYQGFKRTFLAFLNKQTGLKEYKLNKPEKNYKVTIDPSVKNIWPYAVCAIVKGLSFNNERIKEIIDVQEKITSTVGRKRKKLGLGIYPLEKIKFPITYKALEPDKIKFRPLESQKEMTGLQILQKHPTGRDYAHLLAGKSKFPIFIDANKNILSMPPIINSHDMGKIDETTKDVFIECTGTNLDILKKSLNIIVTTLADQGGKVYQMEIIDKKKFLTPNLISDKMKISTENTNKLLGLDLNDKQLKQFIERMGHNYKKGVVEIPAWRTDVLHEVDLIEDVAIAYGYENFKPEIPKISTIGQESPKETFKRKISDILSGLGMLEISNYHLTTKQDQFIKMGIPEKEQTDFIEVEESKTEYNILRKNLTHYILKILSENVDSEYPQKVFETGRVFSSGREVEKLSAAITPGNFTEIKQTLEYLGRMANIKITLEEAKEFPRHFIEGRVAEVKIDNKKAGLIGEIHPKILRNWKIKMPVALFEIEI
jgi:phenylalanyl-tRNA synthetase beta chain